FFTLCFPFCFLSICIVGFFFFCNFGYIFLRTCKYPMELNVHLKFGLGKIGGRKPQKRGISLLSQRIPSSTLWLHLIFLWWETNNIVQLRKLPS
uniref:Uncharacterized protein n=1 Tax=Castor canadensis TaxID=51338 RepID=A0A8C0W9M1_CASCN